MTKTLRPVPVALTIAGSDSGGGAGIQADLKTFSALGVYGTSVITAITAQNTHGVRMVEGVSPQMIVAQIQAVTEDLTPAAIKMGMIGGSAAIRAVASALPDPQVPVILDPVMVAKSGDALLPDEAVETLRAVLLPRCALLTPNLPEAARLLETAPARDEDEMARQGAALRALGARAVLMKGGHAEGPTCTDLLVTGDGILRFSADRHATRNTHGTGCTLSAAIAAALAQGHRLNEAVGFAHGYLQGAIGAADGLRVGSGTGPVHHFHAVWADG